VAQELYDGDGKKLITYPRAEARYLSENQIGDVPAIVAALTRLRGFAQLEIASPVIRRGKSGHFCDRALEGVSHHAVVPNVNVLDDLETRLARLSEDEKRLFALVCRSYLAAVMPDFEYRQTVVTMSAVAEFRAVGRIPLRLGWKAVYRAVDPDVEAETEQPLPSLSDGENAILSDPRVEAKRTQPPPRYNEGTLVDAMQNAWRFVDDPALRERLKEAKGIGTPATRAESGRTYWPRMASWCCRPRRDCSCSSFCAARRRHSSIPGQQLCGRCVWTRLSPGGWTFGR
jgi:DNA topoisomerase-3